MLNINNKFDLIKSTSPKEIVFKYLAHLPIFIVLISLALTSSHLYIRYTTPIYSVSSSILIKDDEKTSRGTAQISLEDLLQTGGNKNVENEKEIIVSRPIIERVVTGLDLQTKYFKQGKIRLSEVYKDRPFTLNIIKNYDKNVGFVVPIQIVDTVSFLVGEKKSILRKFNTPFRYKGRILMVRSNGNIDINSGDDKYLVHWLAVDNAINEYISLLKVKSSSQRSSVLILSMQLENPQKGMDVLNRLMYEYGEAGVEDKNQKIANTIKFIDERLNIISNELGNVEGAMENFREKNNVINFQAQSAGSLENIDEVEKRINELSVKITVLKYIQDYLSNEANAYNLVPSNMGIEDLTLIGLTRVYNEKVLERITELKTIPALNPKIKVLEAQIERLRMDILENLVNLQNGLKAEKSTLDSKLRQIQKYLIGIPSSQRKFLEIDRQQSIKQSLYLFLLQRREENAIAIASSIANTRVVNPAILPKVPVKPTPKTIYLIAGVLGLLFSIGIVQLKDLLNDKIRTQDDITKNTDVPIIGEISHSEHGTGIILLDKTRSIVSEQFRILRTNLQFLLKGIDKPIILLTSSVSGEGKSFTSLNLSSVLSITGKKTVVLEMDLRKPKLAENLGLRNTVGITNYVIGNATLDAIIQKVSTMDNLWVITCGPIPPNPSEILLDSKIGAMFEYLKQNFDYIVIDTAPIGLVSDAQILGTFADCSLYLTRQRYTLKKQINLINDCKEFHKLPNIGIIVNDVKVGGTYGYYGYGKGYGYGYGYGGYGSHKGYYLESDKKQSFISKVKSFFNLN